MRAGGSGIEGDERSGSCGQNHVEVFRFLTAKQRDALRHVAENRTTKEIAFILGISESAVNQRIENVRARTGSPPRSELARSYRQYLQEVEQTPGVPFAPAPPASDATDHTGDAAPDATPSLPVTPDSAPEVESTGHEDTRHRVVAKSLEGPNAGLARVAAIVVIAVGMLLIVMIGLGVARVLTQIF